MTNGCSAGSPRLKEISLSTEERHTHHARNSPSSAGVEGGMAGSSPDSTGSITRGSAMGRSSCDVHTDARPFKGMRASFAFGFIAVMLFRKVMVTSSPSNWHVTVSLCGVS